MNLSELVDRASAIDDPAVRADVRRMVLDLAVNPSAEQRKKYGDSQGRFPVWNRASLHSAILLARKPADRRRIIRIARKLGLSSMIPDTWSLSLSDMALQGVVDLASTIAPRNPSGLANDGRRRYKHQGRWKHGFVPVDTAASESKSKGSPIAMRRMSRLFGTGRSGQRSTFNQNKTNASSVDVNEGHQAGAESAKSLGALRNSSFTEGNAKARPGLPSKQFEASRQSRIPPRAKQNWDEIPDNLKTVRNGVRYVYAEFGGKGFVTPWVGGVQGVSGASTDQRKVYATLGDTSAAQMSGAQLRDIIANPRTPSRVKKVAQHALTQKAKEPRRG